ncbi:MAG: type II secretion system protein F [Candidatus Dactylopiibacterium carminicum]|uniref:Type II secretion system F family protein n=1 Tax=Candidatus Dactylopiibacterium carminicum TaxID=857335 RepID=A0A272ETC1_9RHOO|nr:type II secretion system F family protein [Candidatus Dactylopiibacterium carminicum]KAF7599341.1 type II secretion system F family protein [Candidatus Dactylopiibacterium carminicum]PAS93351.1 MAG: type II secretion system protein F [Candidatus Dactylopiibacterium carminicum]PAS98305.1 MAG: type II secretion system protein F [Candidatus Dactylopiibacterium carminicum]PAS99348.1 MAG: type II secretion system protein F [Candidatus Dactylopiibacterium carminicum]
MATSTRSVRRPAPAKQREIIYAWEGKDKSGKIIRGELRAQTESVVQATLRRQGITVTKVKKRSFNRGSSIKDKDIAIFTRQLATMMRAGVPLLQSFDIAIKGTSNPALGRLLNDIRSEVETGTSLANSLRKHPAYFDALFCNLVAAGEQSGALEDLLDRIAIYKEKMLAIKSKIKSALFYPISVLVVASGVTAVMMLFVIPEFKKVFTSFGADLPAPTLFVLALSDFMVANAVLIFGTLIAAIVAFSYAYKRSPAMQAWMDRVSLQIPVIGDILRKATIARWTRTLSTMFAAGVPLVEALDSVAGAAGNHVYKVATRTIQNEVATGTSLTVSMQGVQVFPAMVVQMISIGEEAGQIDSMSAKVADFFEREVDDMVAGLSQLLEPLIIVILGTLIGGMVVAMYLPIFKLGGVV